MKTRIQINVMFTDGTILAYRRTIDGFLPGLDHGIFCYGDDLQLVRARRYFDLETMTLHLAMDVEGEVDARDIPFDPSKWSFERL